MQKARVALGLVLAATLASPFNLAWGGVGLTASTRR